MSDKLTALQKLELDELESAMNELDLEPGGTDFLTGESPTEEAKKRFRVRDLDTLNWAFRKVAALTALKQNIDQLKKNEIARIETWHAAEAKKTNDNLSFFNFIIDEYAREQQEKNEKYKGESTPYGTLSFKKQQEKWTYTNEQKAVEALEKDEKYKEHIKVEKTIANKANVKKIFEVKKNVFISAAGRLLEAATTFHQVGELGTLPEGLTFKCIVAEDEKTKENYIAVVDIETGEIAKDVFFVEIGVFLDGVQVEGVQVEELPVQVVIKPEVHS